MKVSTALSIKIHAPKTYSIKVIKLILAVLTIPRFGLLGRRLALLLHLSPSMDVMGSLLIFVVLVDNSQSLLSFSLRGTLRRIVV